MVTRIALDYVDEVTRKRRPFHSRKNELRSSSTDRERARFVLESRQLAFLHVLPCISDVWRAFFTALFTIGRAVDRPLYRCVYCGDRMCGCGDTTIWVERPSQKLVCTNSVGFKGLIVSRSRRRPCGSSCRWRRLSVSTAYDRFIKAAVRAWIGIRPFFPWPFSKSSEWNWEEDRAWEERVTVWVSAGLMSDTWRTSGRERDRLDKQTEKEVIQRRWEGESREIDVEERLSSWG